MQSGGMYNRNSMSTDFLSVFTDASFCEGIAGIACIVKNNSLASAIELKRIKSENVLYAELEAILLGIQTAQKFHKHIKIFSDNQMAVDFVSEHSKCSEMYFPIVQTIIQKIQEYQEYDVDIHWISRNENKQADALAVYAARRGTDLFS